MTRISLVALVAATTMIGTAASAQGSYQQRQEQYQEAVRQNDQQQRDYQHARRQWERGQMLPQTYRSGHYMVSDYRSHGWNRPPRGYAYYNTDSGDVVMAAVATGVISSIIVNSGDHRDHHRHH
jgi:Ni/Co efflux regulator RcnB